MSCGKSTVLVVAAGLLLSAVLYVGLADGASGVVVAGVVELAGAGFVGAGFVGAGEAGGGAGAGPGEAGGGAGAVQSAKGGWLSACSSGPHPVVQCTKTWVIYNLAEESRYDPTPAWLYGWDP